MAGITLETAQSQLDAWLEAERKVTKGQSYQIGNRTLTYADVDKIGERIAYWSNKVEELSRKKAGRNRMYHFVPRDL